MKFEIVGSSMQTLLVELDGGEAMYTERGGMAWLSNVDMDTSAKGGLMKRLGRMVSGESLFMTTYTARRGGGEIAFTPEAPGKVLSMALESGQAMLCQRDAFMCAEDSVDLSVHFHQRLGAGLFGGEGFFLQRVEGPGYVFFEIAGEAYETTIASGGVLSVDPGHIALLEPTVDFSITRVRGVRNMLLGGEGLFLAKLTGPGRVWLQSLPLPNLAAKLNRYSGKPS
jgi:uncharacterized protein (TIGR00266 family)